MNKKFKMIVVSKKKLIVLASALLILLFMIVSLFGHLTNLPANIFVDPESGIIVIDPGHGGIDGGTTKSGIVEKEINLEISKKLKVFLEQKGYAVVLTREEDVSLETADGTGGSRHQRDLNTRANIINNSNAQLFLSIHVNCNLNKPSTDGSIVFYGDKFEQNKTLAYCIQRALNGMTVNDKKRTIHDPQQGNYFLLTHSQIPGAIVETAFISNAAERQLLTTDEFREQLARAIAEGVEQYINEPGKVFAPEDE